MEFQIERELTNARPPKDNKLEVVTTPTAGNMRLSDAAAVLLGVVKGDFLGIVVATVEGGDKGIFIHKGAASKDGNKGSKLASPSDKIGGSLLFSSSYAYQTLKGNANEARHYTVDETPVENNGVKYFRLRAGEIVPKVARKTAEATA